MDLADVSSGVVVRVRAVSPDGVESADVTEVMVTAADTGVKSVSVVEVRASSTTEGNSVVVAIKDPIRLLPIIGERSN